jgi:hypothetical protein
MNRDRIIIIVCIVWIAGLMLYSYFGQGKSITEAFWTYIWIFFIPLIHSLIRRLIEKRNKYWKL